MSKKDLETGSRALKNPSGGASSRKATGKGRMDFADQRESFSFQAGLQSVINSSPHVVIQRMQSQAVQESVNNTGLPDVLKTGIEGLSGLSLDDVRVHYNSPKPAGLQALAYTQGAEIHISPGQERHLPHEAWHVVQQKQGRVPGTSSIKGNSINSDPRLEQEASIFGTLGQDTSAPFLKTNHQGMKSGSTAVVQRQSLNEIYDERVKGNEEKTGFLTDFVRLLALLQNEGSVLQILRTQLFQNANWLGRLKAAELGTFSAAQPTLIGGVPPAFFLAMLGAMQSFQDMLGGGHGIHTHRIQWFVIKYFVEQKGDFNHTVKELYQEMANPFWMNANKTLWDMVVDRTEMDDNFATPEAVMFALNKAKMLEYSEDENTARETKKMYLGIWDKKGPGDKPIRGIFEQIEIGGFIFTGFNQKTGKPTVVYQSSEKDLIPKGV